MAKRVTTVVNLKDGGCDVYIGGYPGGEMSRWGNPYQSNKTLSRERAIQAFKALLWKRMQHQPDFIPELMRLDGKRLGCWCKPEACHGDVIVAAIEYIKKQQAQQQARIKEEDERHAAAVALD